MTASDQLYQRFYTSQFGRFMSADRFAGSADYSTSGSWNKYSYVLGDPVNKNDASGQHSCDTEDDDEDDECSSDSGDDTGGGVAPNAGLIASVTVTCPPQCGTPQPPQIGPLPPPFNPVNPTQYPVYTPPPPVDNGTTVISVTLTGALPFAPIVGVGGSGTFVPSTGTGYLGVAGTVGTGTGSGFSISVTFLPSGTDPNGVALGLGYGVATQPSPWLGGGVTKNPGTPLYPVVSVGTKAPISVNGGYNWCVLNCPGK